MPTSHLATITAALALCAAGVGVLQRVRRSWLLVTVDGTSMMPTLRPGQKVLVRLGRSDAVRVGNLVVARTPEPSHTGVRVPPTRPALVIKRVAAMAGDPVPRPMVEAGSAEPGTCVPDGHAALLGDNRNNSADSRIFGFMPVCCIVGVVHRVR
jgi:signal peptidase I